MTVQTFNASDTWTCPPYVTSATVECWAKAGDGAKVASGGGGGGGGAYSRSVVAVTPGQSYSIEVNNPFSFPANAAMFGTGPLVMAVRGATGDLTTGGAGGAAASGVGDVKYSGGDGADGAGGTGGGGGSSAGSAANGATATDENGATAPSGGGDGGDGTATTGNAGSAPGGGGGGGVDAGGGGEAGKVVLTYTNVPGVRRQKAVGRRRYGAPVAISPSG